MNFSNVSFEYYETYDGILGAIYTPAKTTFRLWAPTASRVQLKLYTTGSDNEPGAKNLGIVDLIKDINGTWLHECYYDCKNLYYTYLITVNRMTNEVVDIYAKAAGVNGNRGMIIDLCSTNPDNWINDKRKVCRAQTDAAIWEVHIKDFSFNPNSGISAENRGKFLAFTEKTSTLNGEGTIKTCVNYLKDLGITHVHLLPAFDQSFLDETNHDSEAFNWGYDPKNYNVPEGSYSSNPY
ncbi:MAG: type I pullulanase, partial [Clostridium sp.]